MNTLELISLALILTGLIMFSIWLFAPEEKNPFKKRNRKQKRTATVQGQSILKWLKETSKQLPQLESGITGTKIDHYGAMKTEYQKDGKKGVQNYLKRVKEIATR